MTECQNEYIRMRGWNLDLLRSNGVSVSRPRLCRGVQKSDPDVNIGIPISPQGLVGTICWKLRVSGGTRPKGQ